MIHNKRLLEGFMEQQFTASAANTLLLIYRGSTGPCDSDEGT